METSSPLAAMHRPSAPFGKRDLFANLRVRMSPGKPRGNGALSIRDQLNQDYMGFKPVHGSSPAGSLAVDLCQNFTLGDDSSPRFPTPRRALFTSHGAVDKKKSFLKAPSLPTSSSPLTMDDLMEMTPVPNKRAADVSEIEIRSPSPASLSPAEDMLLESPCPGPQPTGLEASRPLGGGIERRKPLRRASLTRTKGYSFAGASSRFHNDNQLPFFRFGESRLPAAAPTSTLSMAECFQESPPPSPPPPQPLASESFGEPLGERRPQTSHSPSAAMTAAAVGPIRTRQSFVSLSSAAAAAAAVTASRNGSPIGHGHGHGLSHAHGHVRRTSSSFMRPRRQYRRSLSMFENPADMTKPRREDTTTAAALQPSLLSSVMDTDEPTSPQPALPHFFPEDQNDTIPRIGRDTLLDVLDGQYNDSFEHTMVIDCRFEYEYEGGHISAAINFNDKDQLMAHLFGGVPNDSGSGSGSVGVGVGRTLLVLHCEYSAHRAPLMARLIRAQDRAANVEQYPRLTYPELYILDGGYSGFFNEHPARCYPQAYVEMDAAEHASACEREMGRLRQNRRGLHRAQTFAFGQEQPKQKQLQSQLQRPYQFNGLVSPSRPAPFSHGSPTMMLGASPILGSDRGHARRMASY